jgi:hypothetical protein
LLLTPIIATAVAVNWQFLELGLGNSLQLEIKKAGGFPVLLFTLTVEHSKACAEAAALLGSPK